MVNALGPVVFMFFFWFVFSKHILVYTQYKLNNFSLKAQIVNRQDLTGFSCLLEVRLAAGHIVGSIDTA